MSVTKMNDIINPEVMADIINSKIEAQCKMTPYAKVDTTLQGVAGDTITVPCWNAISDAEDFDPEVASDTDAEMPVEKLTAGSTTFTVKCIGKSVGILQTAINSGLGNPVGQANSQLARAVTNKIDNDVVDCAYTGTKSYNGVANEIGYAGIVGAVCGFGDEEDGIAKVMFIHPEQEVSLLTDSNFTSADKFTAGVAVKGSIGMVAGCWVKKSKKVALICYEKNSNGTVTIDADNLKKYQAMCEDVLSVGDKVKALSAPYYKNPIIKMEADSPETEYTEDELPAMTIFLKKDIQLDHEWFPKKQRHDFTVSKYYGVAKTNDDKIIIAKFKGVVRA